MLPSLVPADSLTIYSRHLTPLILKSLANRPCFPRLRWQDGEVKSLARIVIAFFGVALVGWVGWEALRGPTEHLVLVAMVHFDRAAYERDLAYTVANRTPEEKERHAARAEALQKYLDSLNESGENDGQVG